MLENLLGRSRSKVDAYMGSRAKLANREIAKADHDGTRSWTVSRRTDRVDHQRPRITVGRAS